MSVQRVGVRSLEGATAGDVDAEQCRQMGDKDHEKRAGGDRNQSPRYHPWAFFWTRGFSGFPGGESEDAGSNCERDEGGGKGEIHDASLSVLRPCSVLSQ